MHACQRSALVLEEDPSIAFSSTKAVTTRRFVRSVTTKASM